MAQQARGSGFARPGVAAIADYPASGRFATHRAGAGPADLRAVVPQPITPWRLCGDCSYGATAPKRLKAIAIYANFQPIGGTIRYRF